MKPVPLFLLLLLVISPTHSQGWGMICVNGTVHTCFLKTNFLHIFNITQLMEVDTAHLKMTVNSVLDLLDSNRYQNQSHPLPLQNRVSQHHSKCL